MRIEGRPIEPAKVSLPWQLPRDVSIGPQNKFTRQMSEAHTTQLIAIVNWLEPAPAAARALALLNSRSTAFAGALTTRIDLVRQASVRRFRNGTDAA